MTDKEQQVTLALPTSVPVICLCCYCGHGGEQLFIVSIFLTLIFVYAFTEQPMLGQKVRLQTRPRSLRCMNLKLPGRLPGSSHPTSTSQVILLVSLLCFMFPSQAFRVC